MRSVRIGGTFVLVLGAWACAHGTRVVAREETPPAAPAAAEDPTSALIAAADRHLEAGIAELKQGHLTKAREEFDRAVDAYLTAPGGAYANARLGEAYRRTLEAIHLREIEALAAGDGFSEPLPEPASIDEVGEITVAEAPPSEETRRTAEEAVREEVNDFPVELNDAVLACVDLYQGRLREWFGEALVRGGRYLPHIRKVFAEAGIPQDLAYTALVESAFKTQALSRAKAKGVWQFISTTGKRYGLQQDWWVDERSDPEKATRAAAKYLKELHGLLGDWNLALAGYNAGEYKVLRGISRYGTNDYWRLRKTRAFRTETKNYVPLIHAAIVVAKAPAKYGFEVVPDEPEPYEVASVSGPVDLRVVAECIATSLDDVRALNPELRRLATPATAAYPLRVPEGRAASLGECLAAVPPEKRVQFRTHVVARGQTFSTIAKKYGIRSQDLADANALSLKRTLSIGQELIIPIEPRTATARSASAKPAPVVTASLQPAASSRVRLTYRIRPGDTLGGIAERYGTTVRELQSWNGLRSTRITAGRFLTIFARKM
ncbi:MAG TPA: LysM peptidoglycan-binding domain-containing protein [Vicinamibacteria bacterium]|nr:LysM peptidoglycan-binding domain-containing protein [Vicinamibacteria bacterium]